MTHRSLSITKCKERPGFDLTFCAPMSASLAFVAVSDDERERILAAFGRQVSEDLEEMESTLGTAGIPIQLQTHHEISGGRTFLHTHCFVSKSDVPDPRELFRWVGEKRRALQVDEWDHFSPDTGSVLAFVDQDEASIIGETGTGPTSSLNHA